MKAVVTCGVLALALVAGGAAAKPAAKGAGADPAIVAAGAKVFETNCQVCHQAGGVGVTGAFPRLAGRVSVIASSPDGRKFLSKLVPPMLEHALDLAEGRAELLKYEAIDAARLELDAEHARLVALRAVNPSIAAAEVDAIAAERDALLAAIPAARLRLDAVRFVVSPDFLSLR